MDERLIYEEALKKLRPGFGCMRTMRVSGANGDWAEAVAKWQKVQENSARTISCPVFQMPGAARSPGKYAEARMHGQVVAAPAA